MAFTGYGAKYTLTFSDVYQNTTGQYIATIYKKGYSGFVHEVSGTGTPLVIETDSDGGNGGYRPVIATKATLNLLFNYVGEGLGTDEWTPNENIWETYQKIFSESGFDIREFITANFDTFLLEVKIKNGGSYNIIWQGYFIYNTDVSLSEIAPITFSLQFSDFGLMKINRFYNFEAGNTNLIRYFPSDKISLLDVIMRCCYFSYITNKVSLEYPFPYSLTQSYVNGNGATVNSTIDLSSMLIQKNAFLQELGKYKTLFEVLEGLCSQFGLIAFYKNNILHIRSYDSLVNNTTENVDTIEYTVDNYDVATDEVEYSFYAYASEYDPIRPLNSTLPNIGRSQTIRFNYPIENVVISNSASLNYNTPNYNMSSVSEVARYTGAGSYYAVNSWYEPSGRELIYQGIDAQPNTIQARPFYPYALLKTQSFGTNYATKFPAKYQAGFDLGVYIDSEEFSVSSGDVFSFSYLAWTDGRLKNLPPTGGTINQFNYRPRPVVALVLIANDENGVETTFYYNYTNNKFESGYTPTASGSLPLTLIPNYLGNDSDKIYYDIKGVLDIPDNAKIKIRQYQPYRNLTVASATDPYQLFVEYCNLQTFKGSIITGLPTSQKFITKFDGFVNSDNSFSLESGVFISESQKYVPPTLFTLGDAKAKNPMYVAGSYGNNIFDAYNNPASGIALSYQNIGCANISYASLKTQLGNISSAILKNIGLSNVTIEGTFKSDASLFIGRKFSYQITSYNSVNFALLDYSIDLKNATYDALLYSSKFSDSTGKTVVNQTVIS